MSPRLRRMLDHVVHERIDPLLSRSARAPRSARCRQIPLAQQPRAHRVVDVVVDVGHAVDHPHDPALERLWQRCATGVTGDPVAHLLGQVEPGAVALQPVHDPQRVLVVAERPAPKRSFRHSSNDLLADVPERRVPEIVAEPDRLHQILVERQRPRRPCARSSSPRACASGACGSGRPAGATNTCVLCVSRRNALQCTILSRSR